MPKPKKKNPMGDYLPSPEDYTAMRYCIDKRICKIAPLAKVNDQEWYIEVYTNGKWNKSPETFGPGEVWEQIFKYYNYYYEKYRKS